MSRRTLDVCDVLRPEELATDISNTYMEWSQNMEKKHIQWGELRDYIFATDTTTTTNSSLPWKNKTTRPKLCQIRDNLHANYLAALFPNDKWFKWEGGDDASETKEKRTVIEAYMGNKLRESRFKETVSRLVFDYIDYGNCYADVSYLNDTYKLPDGTDATTYIGPKLNRISPYDIKYNITAADFATAPKIIRQLLSFGDLEKLKISDPDWAKVSPTIWTKIKENRKTFAALGESDVKKSKGFVADGFSNFTQYYKSGLVEFLTFYGDFYDTANSKLYQNHVITIVDRCYVVRNEPISNWFGRAPIEHCGWRLRPDNLVAMGPLDNLVGLQYRIDHLENLKADVFDLIAHPLTKVKGHVEDFVYGPNERIYMEADSDVEMMRPDATALNASFEIDKLELEMEEMAGAPKQAMGIRTPGEKTAYEVQSLENASGRMFQSKISYFEEHFLEPLLNFMLETARRNIDGSDLIRVVDDDIGVVEFLELTKDELTAKGKLIPLGARHFAAQAQLIQNLTGLGSSAIYQDQSVNVHFSGFAMAKLIEENLGLTGVVRKNARIDEQMESQALANSAQDQTMTSSITPLDEAPTDGSAPDPTENPDPASAA